MNFTSDNRPPALCLDYQEKAIIADQRERIDYSFVYPKDNNRKIFSEPLINGDSGNPAFSIVDGELVLHTVWTYGGPGTGPSISRNLNNINLMIKNSDLQAGLDTGFLPQTPDMSKWIKYSK